MVEEVIEPEVVPAWKPRTSLKRQEAELAKGNPLPMMAASSSKEEFLAKAENATISQGIRDELCMPCVQFSLPGEKVTNARAIGKVLMQKALAGDMSAIREILNRSEGKVVTRTESMSASLNVKANADSISALMQKIDKNRGDA